MQNIEKIKKSNRFLYKLCSNCVCSRLNQHATSNEVFRRPKRRFLLTGTPYGRMAFCGENADFY
jgi:hypothetical protein